MSAAAAVYRYKEQPSVPVFSIQDIDVGSGFESKHVLPFGFQHTQSSFDSTHNDQSAQQHTSSTALTSTRLSNCGNGLVRSGHEKSASCLLLDTRARPNDPTCNYPCTPRPKSSSFIFSEEAKMTLLTHRFAGCCCCSGIIIAARNNRRTAWIRDHLLPPRCCCCCSRYDWRVR